MSGIICTLEIGFEAQTKIVKVLWILDSDFLCCQKAATREYPLMGHKRSVAKDSYWTPCYLYIDLMPATDKMDYARTLFERLDEGVVVPLRPVRIEHDEGTWEPEAQHSDGNVAFLEEAYPNDLEAVRGWLVVDFRSVFGEMLSYMTL